MILYLLLRMEIMERLTYEDLFKVMKNGNTNLMILGKAGSGKTFLINRLNKIRNDIILVAPTGIAASNINGKTLHSQFGIREYDYDINTSIEYLNPSSKYLIKTARILLIDEISMCRFDTLDKIDKTCRVIRENEAPFGGLRLIFIGDFYQLEPVILNEDIPFIMEHYPEFDGDGGFYKARCMKNYNYFLNTFEIYNLMHNFRQGEDKPYQNILDEVRGGNVSAFTINSLNSRYIESIDYFEYYCNDFHFLTLSRRKAAYINNFIMDKLPGDYHRVSPVTTYIRNGIPITRSNLLFPLTMKEGIKVMFVINDKCEERKWSNGTFGKILSISKCGDDIDTVRIAVYSKEGVKEYNVGREKDFIYGLVFVNNIPYFSSEPISFVENFPFIPAFATTIHKIQGVTLDKAALVLDNYVRVPFPNQIYVGVSRVRTSENLVICDRPLSSLDIKTSEKYERFINSIKPMMKDVYHIPVTNISNINKTAGIQRPIKIAIKKPLVSSQKITG